MADLPEYQKSQSIQTAAQPLGFAGVMADVGKLSTSIISELGMKAAQAASNQRAALAGAETGATKPGLNLLPFLGESDKHFQQAYQDQEYATAVKDGSNYLERIRFEALKNPSAEGLALYDESYINAIDTLSNNLSKVNASRVKEQLSAKALVGRYDIEGQILQKDNKYLVENFQAAFEQSIKSINDLMGLGDEKSADAIIETTNSIIDSPDIQVSPSVRIKLKEALEQAKTDSKYRAEMTQAIKDGKGEELLKDIAGEKLTSANAHKAEVMAATYKNHQMLVSAYESKYVDKLTAKAKMGELSQSDMVMAESQLGASSFAAFEVKVAKILAAQKEQAAIFDYADENKSNALALSRLTPDQLNGYFAEKVKRTSIETGMPPDLQMEAEVARTIDAPISSFNKRVSAGINSNNPDVARQAAGVYGSLMLVNPNAMSGVTAEAGQKADTLNRLLTNGSEPDKAVEAASKHYDNLTPTQVKERGEMYERIIQTKAKWKTIDKQKSAIASSMGFNKDIIPDGLTIDFMTTLKEKYMESGNFDDALKNTTDQLSQVYSETDLNGFKQVMKNAPDRHLPTAEVRSMIRQEADNLFSSANVDFEKHPNSKGLYRYVTPTGKAQTINVEGKNRLAGLELESLVQPVYIERFDSKGNMTKGTLLVLPDRFSEFLPEGTKASYGMWFYEDGALQPQPIYDVNKDYSNARFTITDKNILDYLQKTLSQEQLEARQIDEHIRAQLQQKIKVLEARLETGEEP